jgi:hypothetical protein
MLRDSIRNIEYFNDAILHSEDRENQYKVRLSNTNQLNPLGKMGASIGLFGFVLNNLEFSYSKGDAISSYKPNVIKLLKYREMQKFFSDELIEEEQNRRVEWERLSFSNYKKTLNWLAFAVSTGTNQDYFKTLFELVDNKGLDTLFDRIAIKLGDTDRLIGSKVLYAKPYQLLLDPVDADGNQQATLMNKFMDAWYPACVKNGFYETHNITNNFGYSGYWCFEAALVTLVFNLDDTGYRNHKYYPAALVHGD